MFLCTDCGDSLWAVTRLDTAVVVVCKSYRKIEATERGSTFRRCGKSFLLPPWYEMLPTVKRE